MQEGETTVLNSHGIHCRPSSMICKEARSFQADIQANSDTGTANCKNMLELISLGLSEGKHVRISCDGPDEDEALAKMLAMFADTFDLVYRND